MKKTAKQPAKKTTFLCLFILALLAGLMAGDAVAAESAMNPPKKALSPQKPAGLVSVDFKDADIRTVIRSIAMMTGKNFIVDDKVKGKVTIISPRQVSVSEAMRVFESTLEVYGYTLIDAGSAIKVVPAAEARQRSAYRPGKGPGDRMVTRLIPLKHVKATDIVNSLRPLIPPTSYMTGYKETNTLIVADYESNIDKILRIVEKLDTPKHEESVTVIHLQYAGAKELAGRLAKIYKNRPSGLGVVKAIKGGARATRAGYAGGSGPKFIPDERINAIMVVAGRTVTDQILSLISQLDIPPPPGRGGINVYMLKNADAEDVAKVLNNMAGTKGASAKKGAPATRISKLRNKVNVTPDKATNSLVITGSVEDYETLKEVIKKLDIRRAQVFVEALIMEVTTSKTKQFGVEWRTTSNFNEPGVKAIGGTNFGNINNVAGNPLDTPKGLAIGVIDGTISFGGKKFLNLGALVHALQSDTDINILSTPNIMTTDNEEATIVVAQQVPFSTGAAQNTGGTTLTTIERKDIGLTLKITPQISESNDVRMDVYQEISSISPVQLDKAQDIITNTRSIETTVIVKDAQNVVLGGLIRDDLNEVENKVPLLGDIPLLGWLFKSTSKEWQKTNLLVFLTPHIIRRKSDLDRITNGQKLNESAPEVFKKRLLDFRHKSKNRSTMDKQEPEESRPADKKEAK